MVRCGVSHLENVTIITYSGLLVDFLKANDVKIIIRGLRAVSDFELELQMAHANKAMLQELETLFSNDRHFQLFHFFFYGPRNSRIWETSPNGFHLAYRKNSEESSGNDLTSRKILIVQLGYNFSWNFNEGGHKNGKYHQRHGKETP